MHLCEWAFHQEKMVPASQATLPITSHVVNFGTGTLDSIRVYQVDNEQVTVGLPQHIDRIQLSLNSLLLPVLDADFIYDATLQFITNNQMKNGYLRYFAYADGSCSVLDTLSSTTRLSIMGWHTSSVQQNKSVSLGISYLNRPNPASTLARAKLCGGYVMDCTMQGIAKNLGYDTALILNEDGTVCEAAGANIYIVKNNVLLTPFINNSIHGITSRIIQDLAATLNLSVRTQPLVPEDIFDADEVFLTGTLSEITPVNKINHVIYQQPGSVTQLLKNAFTQLVAGKSPISSRWVTRLIPTKLDQAI